MKILENISLAQLCTFGIGGNARYLINIKTKQDLLDAVEFANKHNLPTFILGAVAILFCQTKVLMGLFVE